MARIPGVGLAKGLSVTLRHMLRRSVTQQYPEVHPDLPPRSRGVIALVEENCTSCMLCARECPDWCIYIDSHKETLPAPEGGRARQRNVLDRFAIDFSLCMYCGICIEVCPFDALFWSPEFEYAEGDIRNLLHEKGKLGSWVETVPPPQTHELGAEPPKELTAAPRAGGPAASRAAGSGASRAAGPAGSSAAGSGASRAAGPASSHAAGRPAGADTEAPPAGGAPERTATRAEGSPDRTAGADAGAEGAPGRAVGAEDSSARSPGAGASSDRPDEAFLADHRAGASDRTVAPAPAPAPTPDRAGPTPDLPDASPGRAEGSRDRRSTAPSPVDETTPGSDPARESAVGEQPAPEGETGPSSTGQPPSEDLSTGSGAPSPESAPREQTSAAEPRRRRMADPRSIRPPGRLKPDEPRESEEET